MGFDFNEAEKQSERKNYGPVPEGSTVLLKMELADAGQYAHPKDKTISRTQSGLYKLCLKMTVMAGTYEGVWWFEQWHLPAGQQDIRLTEKERKACNWMSSRFRAVIEAARNVNPDDTSAGAASQRKVNSFHDFDGLTFPAVVSINPRGREYKGNVYYSNQVATVVTPDKDAYSNVMAGGELINEDGATRPKDAPAPAQSNSYNTQPAGSEAFPAGNEDLPF